MGRCAGLFLVGSDYAYPTLLGFRKHAKRLVKEAKVTFALTESSFVFLMHQGYSFLFFDCSAADNDPPVYLFTETEKEPRKVYGAFSQWLLQAIKDDEEAYKSAGYLPS